MHRVQKIIENAVKMGRKVAVSGRSMENVVALAIELGYLDIPPGMLVDLKMTKNIPDDKLVIITTGSQGEPMSALTRMAMNDSSFCIPLSSLNFSCRFTENTGILFSMPDWPRAWV